MAMKKALAGAAVAAGLLLVVGDTAIGAARDGDATVNVRSGGGGNGGQGGAGGGGGQGGSIGNRGNSGNSGSVNNNGVRRNTKRRSGSHAHPRKQDPRPNNGFDF